MHGVLRVSDLPHSDKIKYLNCGRCDRGSRGLDSRRSCSRLRPKAKWLRLPKAAAAPAEPEVAKKGKTEARRRSQEG